jgi:hypothetical protein
LNGLDRWHVHFTEGCFSCWPLFAAPADSLDQVATVAGFHQQFVSLNPCCHWVVTNLQEVGARGVFRQHDVADIIGLSG